MKAACRDLAEFGLPLIGPDDPAFLDMVRDMKSRPEPFPPWPDGNLDNAAVLLNQSGRAIIALAYIWRYATAGGQTRFNRGANLGSSRQLEVLRGKAKVTQDLGSFILPGSKRLITEQGMFGNNLDVLPPDFGRGGGGYIGAGGGGGFRRERGEAVTAIEICLDFAILEDGLCAGPDESGLFETVTWELETQRKAAREVVEALRGGASVGQVFEILRPLARRTPEMSRASAEHGRFPSPMLSMFADMGIRRLVDAESGDLVAWFQDYGEATPLRLYRPG